MRGIISSALATAACVFLSACGGGGGGGEAASTLPPVPAPAITEFAAEPAIVTPGGLVFLTATFTDGTGEVNFGVGPVFSGEAILVAPHATTAFTLSVTGANDTVVTSSIVVHVVDVMVTSLDDAGPGTLRDAMLLLDTRPEGGSIGIVVDGEIDLASSLPPVLGPIEIVGAAAGTVSIDAGNAVRPFFVGASGVLSLWNLTVRGGAALGFPGGDGQGNFAQSGGAGGGAGGMGGAVFVSGGTFTAVGVRFEGNAAVGGSGGAIFDGTILNGGAGGGGFGGAGADNLTLGGGVGGAGGLLGGAGGAGGTWDGVFGHAAVPGQPGGDGAGGGGGAVAAGASAGPGGAGGFGAGGGGGGNGGGGTVGASGGLGGVGGGGGGGSTGALAGGPGAASAAFGGHGADGGLFGQGFAATGGGGAGLGGALFVRAGYVVLTDCAFEANFATGGPGGGGTATAGQGKAGAVFIALGAIVVQSGCTFAANTASDDTATSGDDDDVFGFFD